MTADSRSEGVDESVRLGLVVEVVKVVLETGQTEVVHEVVAADVVESGLG